MEWTGMDLNFGLKDWAVTIGNDAYEPNLWDEN